MLKDVKVLSSVRDENAVIPVSTKDFTKFVDVFTLCIIKAMSEPQPMELEVIFDHERKNFRVNMKRASVIHLLG